MKDSAITATDQFCGAGGTSTGATEAGVEVKMALNHWKLAIETHNTNHPDTDHDCTDIQACDPRRYPSTNILYSSPECTNHSLAKGKKRKMQNQYKLFGKVDESAERSRATMWDVPRFAEYHQYENIIVENVVDARYWSMWTAWLLAMRLLGYEHKCNYFNSQFFGECPQSRDRLYVVFWKKGNTAPDLEHRPVAPCPNCGDKEAYQWFKNPQKKWGKYGEKNQYLYRCSGCTEIVKPYYYAALNAIDFSEKITRIGDRKRPLAEKTIQRIQHGLDKYKNKHLIITGRYTSGIGCRVRDAHGEVMPTQPGDASHFLLAPQIQSEGYGGAIQLPDTALSTQTCRQDKNLLIPPMITANYSPGYARTATDALPTVTASDSNGLLTNNTLQAFLQYYYGTGNQTSAMNEAIHTVTTRDRAGLVLPDSTTDIKIEDCFYRTLKPHEIQAAMAFPDSYLVLGTGKQKVRQLGNAVTPPVTKWITKRVVDSLER